MSTSNRVLVLDKNKKPLMPCSAVKARKLLRDKKAAVYKFYPFTIILKYREGGDVQDVHIGIDPGTKTTGMAMVAHFERGSVCIYGMHIGHRGRDIKLDMVRRATIRKSRRTRKLRYREPRFDNRINRHNFIAPSIKSRVENVVTWVRRLSSSCNISSVNFEVAKFNTNELSDKSTEGKKIDIKYRYKMRHYLLTLYNGICQYCLTNKGPMEWEHVLPRSRGGTDSLSNATLSCIPCNRDKGRKTLDEWLVEVKSSIRPIDKIRARCIPKVMADRNMAISDASIMNYTRHLIVRHLRDNDYIVNEFPAWETAYNRSKLNLPKNHWIDAAIVGCLSDVNPAMGIFTANGRKNNSRQMVDSDKYGFPRGNAKSKSLVHGFRTGDISKLNKPSGKYKGTYVGPIVVRLRGVFDIRHFRSRISAMYSNFKLLQRSDGYRYIKGDGKLHVTIV